MLGCFCYRWRAASKKTAEQGLGSTVHGTANPALRSRPHSAISGRPTSAVGSRLSIASNRLMPRPSHLKLPAQSRLLGGDVADDFLRVQHAEAYFGQIQGGEGFSIPPETDCRVKAHRLSGHCRQLRTGRLDRARLAQRLTVQVGHLVRADHPGARMAGGHVGGLGGGQARGQGQRGLGAQRGFIHVRACAVEGQAQPFQQFATVAGGGGQDQ